jgi:holliday junction DNA helicase RuvA
VNRVRGTLHDSPRLRAGQKAVEEVLSALVNLGCERAAAVKAIYQAIADDKARAGDFGRVFRGALNVIR